jgi:ABC-type dipeptide/oligopeptide/nickel transport system permease subunit
VAVMSIACFVLAGLVLGGGLGWLIGYESGRTAEILKRMARPSLRAPTVRP